MITQTEYKVLKLFLKKTEVTTDEIKEITGETGYITTMQALDEIVGVANLGELFPIGVITGTDSYITGTGAKVKYCVANLTELHRAVEEYTRDVRRYWITTAIAALALFISIVALIK